MHGVCIAELTSDKAQGAIICGERADTMHTDESLNADITPSAVR